MKHYNVGLLVALLLVLGSVAQTNAQQSPSAAVEAQQLRNELRQLKDRETEIQMRLPELDVALKPENIERSFAGVGSLRPEELREARRKQLQAEKDRLQAQLNEIAQDRSRLEAAIVNADTRAYYESAMQAQSYNRLSPLAGLLAGRNLKVAAGVGAFILISALVALVRRRRSRQKRNS